MFQPETESIPTISANQKINLSNQRKIYEFTIRKRKFIIDSGASFHLVGPQELTLEEHQNTYPMKKPQPLSTANGIRTATIQTIMYIPELDLIIHPIIMDRAPAVLSLGLLIKEGYSFHWEDSDPSRPVLIKGNFRIGCVPMNNVPILHTNIDSDMSDCDDESCHSVPAANSEETPIPDAPKPKGKRQGKSDKSKLNRRLAKKTVSAKECTHNIFTHFPRDPNCEICQLHKVTRAPCKSKQRYTESDKMPPPRKFGDLITADHKIINEDDQSKEGDRAVCVIQDQFTYWLQAYPSKTKSAKETMEAFQDFLGQQQVCERVYAYTDNSEELQKALSDMGILHDTSTPYKSETNGIAERAVRRVSEGTACTLGQSGLTEPWWPDAMRHYCFMRNTVDKLSEPDNMTPYQKRFGVSFQGELFPFGAEVWYRPSNPVEREKLHTFGKG